jgi:hypothetical protein
MAWLLVSPCDIRGRIRPGGSDLQDRPVRLEWVDPVLAGPDYSVGPNTHAIMYTIPGELEVGKRLLNYVRYRNVADGPELDELTEIAATNGTQTVLG